MTSSAQEILKQFKTLSESDRAELSVIIADDSAIRNDMDYVSAWSDEIRSRLLEHDSGQDTGIAWEQVRAEMAREDELAK